MNKFMLSQNELLKRNQICDIIRTSISTVMTSLVLLTLMYLIVSYVQTCSKVQNKINLHAKSVFLAEKPPECYRIARSLGMDSFQNMSPADGSKGEKISFHSPNDDRVKVAICPSRYASSVFPLGDLFLTKQLCEHA